MGFLKKNNVKEKPSEDLEENIDIFPVKEPEKVKKKKIGFRHKEKKKKEKKLSKKQQRKEETFETTVEEPENKEEFAPDIYSEEIKDIRKEDASKPKKKKVLIKKDMKGKPVFLEDTGERLGTVFDTIYDAENHLVGYKIKDNKSDSILSFPPEQFDLDRDGLIFVPSWFLKAVKVIEKLEFKDRISPELTALLTDDTVSNNEVYDIFIKHDDEMAYYIEDTISLKGILKSRLDVLEKKRYSLKDDLMDLTEKRLIKDIDRRAFSEEVMRHRRKVNILDVNINKCKDLMKRLDDTSFGILGKDKMVDDDKSERSSKRKVDKYNDRHDFLKENDNELLADEIKTPYKDKYYTLKGQFDQLDNDYRELKAAAEKLIQKELF